jgi:hypothetical protein
MTRECHVRFCEGLTGRFRWSTRLAALWFCCAKVIHKTTTYKLPLYAALKRGIMKVHHYVGIGIKLFAIWLFLYSIPNMTFFLENILYGTVQGMAASATKSGLIYIPWLVMAVILWNFPLSIAKKIVPPEAQVNPESISASSLLAVLITAISIYFLYRSIMDGVYWATFLNLSEGGVYASFSPENKASIFATLIEFLAAALLFINSRKISVWARNF